MNDDPMIVIARVEDCPLGESRELVVAGRIVALFHVEGQFYALDGVCPHQGGPLGKGAVCGHIVTCPWHGWQFDVRTGAHQIAATIRQPRIPVHRRGEELMVRRADLVEVDEAR